MISQKLFEQEPRCAQKIRKVWEEIIFNTTKESTTQSPPKNSKTDNKALFQKLIQFRFFFPAVRRNDESLYKQMTRYRFPTTSSETIVNANTQNNSISNKEFHFTLNNFKPSPTRELPSISYLRDKLIPYIYCLPNDFYDIPQTILIFTASPDDDTYKIPNIVKSRGRTINYGKEYKQIPMNNIIYQTQKQLKSDLQTFLDQIIKPRFRDAFERVEEEFTKIIVIQHQLDDAIQYGTTLTVAASQHIKRYADYQMMRGEHKMAYSLYHQLLLHFPTEKQFQVPTDPPSGLISSIFSFGSSMTSNSNDKKSAPSSYADTLTHLDCLLSVTFCAVSCDIIIGEINDQTVKNLYFLRDNSPNIQYRLIVSLIIFWILPRIGKPSPEVLLEFLEYSRAIVESDSKGPGSQTTVSEVTNLQTKTMNNSNSLSSLSSFSIFTSVHQSFSLNNLASTIYRQLSSDDMSGALSPGDKTARKLTLIVIVEPYLQEQIIQFYSPRLIPFEYFLLAKRFEQIGQKENYVRCLWNSFILLMNTSEKTARLQYHNCEFCLSFLIEKIVNVLLREKNFLNQPKTDEEWFLSDYIGYLMRFDNIQRLPVFASLFSMWKSDGKFYKTGFIHASVVSFTTEHPMLTGPSGYKGNWRQIAMKLFGYSKSSSSQFNFFYFSNSDEGEKSSTKDDTTFDCLISEDDEIMVKLSITNKVTDFQVGDTWLKINGHATSDHVKVGNGKKNEAIYRVRPNKNGLIQIDGLNILWVNNVNLFAKFAAPINFKVVSKGPSIVIEALSQIEEVLAGDSSMLRLVLHIGQVPLSSLTLLIETDDENFKTNRQNRHNKVNYSTFTILSPQSRNIGGQYFFGPVNSNEDVTVDILCTSTVVGQHSHWLFFSYTSDRSPDKSENESDFVCNRYSSFNYKVNVYKKPDSNPSMFPSFYPDFFLDVSLKPVDDKRRFQLSLSNNMKCEVKNVFIDFLERKPFEYRIANENEKLSENAFDLNFGGYFSNIERGEINFSKSEEESEEFHSTFEKFVIIGFTKKKFMTIGMRKSVAFSFEFESFDKETYPYLRIIVDGKKYISDMSSILRYYDQR